MDFGVDVVGVALVQLPFMSIHWNFVAHYSFPIFKNDNFNFFRFGCVFSRFFFSEKFPNFKLFVLGLEDPDQKVKCTTCFAC